MAQESLDGLGSFTVWHVSLKPEDAATINTREPVYFSPESAAIAALDLIARAKNPEAIKIIYVSRFIGNIIDPKMADRVENIILEKKGIPIAEAVAILGFALQSKQKVHAWPVETVRALSAIQDAHGDTNAENITD